MSNFPLLTSDILAVNFDAPSSPTINVNLSQKFSSSHSFGWGFGWYPGNQQSSMVVKDPAARGTEVMTEAITDWSNFRSNIFFCKVRGADSGYSQAETQPFSRSFAGRDWLFMHNGDLDKNALNQLHGRQRRLLEPLAGTDSELAFCHLLSNLQECGARQLADVAPSLLLSWFQEFDALGTSDMYVSDGQSIACFQGTQSPKQLAYSRLTPPDNQGTYHSNAAVLTIEDARDTYHTAFIVTSSPFSTGNWTLMQPGQLIIANHGVIVWDSAPGTAPIIAANPPPGMSERAQNPPSTDPAFTDPASSNSGLQNQRPVSSLADVQAEQAQSKAEPHVLVTNPRSLTLTPEGRNLTYRYFDLEHSTHYDYSEPVEHSTHLFRLQPVDDPLQEVVHSELEITSSTEEIQFEDVFGNQSIHCTIDGPYSSLTVTAKSRVKIFAAPPDDHSLSRRQISMPLIWMPWQRQMMMPYLLPPELPETQLRELTDYAMSFVERNDFHLKKTIDDINQSIYRDFQYVPGSTSLHTTPFDVYANRQGVCQDFANLFICLTRLLSIPARYRMGYIYTGANYENKIQSDASHAWAEVYLPYIGWRGFDPTNGCMVAQDHIRVACGRNYRDATPTSGTIYKGGGTETLRVEVKMREVTE